MNSKIFLERILKYNGISAHKLASMTGINPSLFSRWNSQSPEKYKIPQFKVILKIAKALNIKPSEVIGRYWE